MADAAPIRGLVLRKSCLVVSVLARASLSVGSSPSST